MSHFVSLQFLGREKKEQISLPQTHIVVILSVYSNELQVNEPFNCSQFYAECKMMLSFAVLQDSNDAIKLPTDDAARLSHIHIHTKLNVILL